MEGTSKYATDWQCNGEKTEFFSRGKSMPSFACFATDDRFRVEFPFPLLLPTSPFRRKHHKNIWTDSQRIGGKGERRRRQLAGILRSGTDKRRQRHKFGQTVIRGEGGGRGGDSLRVPPPNQMRKACLQPLVSQLIGGGGKRSPIEGGSDQ